MPLNKIGSNVKIQIVKKASFSMDVNMIAEMLKKDWPEQSISLDGLHAALKSVGITNYSSEDMDELISRLQATGFAVTK